jgi:LmbE family N-acetylglucosaminyl deacetylase
VLVVLSPHYDDAVLSAAAALLHAPEAKVLITCTAAPDPAAPLSALALEIHARWGLSAGEVWIVREAEDRAACAKLGPAIERVKLGFLDGLYRADYQPRAALIGAEVKISPVDPLPAALLGAVQAQLAQGDRILAPLGVGRHVDHLISFEVGRALEAAGWPVGYYEDIPYVLRPGELDLRLAELGPAWRSEAEALTERELERKIDAVACYRSQLAALFGRRDAMPQALRDHARAAGGERIWRAQA